MARDLNGSSQSLSTAMNLSSYSAITYALWVHPDAWSGSFSMLYELTDAGFSAGRTGLYADNPTAVLTIEHTGSVGLVRRRYSRPSTGTWHHVIGIHDYGEASADEAKLYLNGSLQTPTSSPDTADNSSSDTFLNATQTFGSRKDDSLWADGKFAELAIWGAALNADEAAALGAGFSPEHVRRESLLNYWRLLDDDGDRDWRGSSALSATGSPTYADHPPVIYPSTPRIITGTSTPSSGLPIAAANYYRRMFGAA